MKKRLYADLLMRVLPVSLPKQTLFHYTSLSGFKGIITDRNIWATDIGYLNDTREFTCALDAILSRIDERTKSHPELMKHLRTLIENFALRRETTPPYVVSFSEARDNLSQWRGYCGQGAGVSLGFDPDYLNRLVIELGKSEEGEKNFTVGQLVKCLYPESEKNEVIDKIIDFFLESPPDEAEEDVSDRLQAILGAVWMIAPTFKDQKFEAEVEWRIIARAAGEGALRRKYRDGKSMLLPYIELPLVLEDGLKEVVLGPTPHFELSRESAQNFLKSQIPDFPLEMVSKSDVPFRNW